MVGQEFRLRKNEFLDFTGIFILNEDYPEISTDDYKIFLAFEPKKTRNISYISQIFKFLPSYHADNFTIVYVWDIPDRLKAEYKAFIDGKYSKFSEEYKKCILAFHNWGTENMCSWVMYKKEEAYQAVEYQINKGLPEREWTFIPRTQEIGHKWNESEESQMRETYTHNLKSLLLLPQKTQESTDNTNSTNNQEL